MLTETSTEVRSAKPSMIMRAVKWVIKNRKPIFPQEHTEVAGFLDNRKTPRDARLPEKFENRFRVERWEAAGQDVITLHPKSGPGDWHMLYFHGGGFVLPMAKEHWPMLGTLVEQCKLSITVPLYHLVPEVSYAVQDALADAAFAKLAGEHDPAKIILNGDSAGGHMALALALRLAKSGGAQPGKLALFAPWLDVTMAGPGNGRD